MDAINKTKPTPGYKLRGPYVTKYPDSSNRVRTSGLAINA